MLTVISPAKTLDFDTPPSTRKKTQPMFLERSEGLVEEARNLRPDDIGGLMGMASREGGLNAARRDFANLRRLRDQLAQRPTDVSSLPELSMGMSGDFGVAIEEGATMVRVGSALFEGVDR